MSAATRSLPDLSRLKSVRKGLTDADFRDQITTLALIATEAFKAALACLLVVLVPQLCPAVPDAPDPSLRYPHTCTQEENFDVLDDPVNLAALALNFGTFAALMAHYAAIARKERFMIEFLDEDAAVPRTHLASVLGQYADIGAGLRWHNDRLFYTFVAVAVLFPVNIVVSAVVVGQYYSDFRSVTVFATNLLVIVSILKRSSTAAWAGRDAQAPLAISVMNVGPIVFNQIDADHIAKPTQPSQAPAAAVTRTDLPPRYPQIGLDVGSRAVP